MSHNTPKQVEKALKRLEMGPNQALDCQNRPKRTKNRPKHLKRSQKSPQKSPKWAKIRPWTAKIGQKMRQNRPKHLEIGRKSPEICLIYAFFTHFFYGFCGRTNISPPLLRLEPEKKMICPCYLQTISEDCKPCKHINSFIKIE